MVGFASKPSKITYSHWHPYTMPGSDVASAMSTSQLASNASSGTKRKRGMDKKFYAVRTGYKPGVYSTYADCLAQVKGFKKAICELQTPSSFYRILREAGPLS